MDGKLIVKFEYDTKQFNIYLSKSEEMFCRVVEDSNMREPNPDEKEVFNLVLKSLIINPLTSRFFRSENIFGKTISIYYDYSKRLYFWNNNADDKISSYLNFKYNNIIDCFNNDELDEKLENSSETTQKDNKEFFNRVVHIPKKNILLKIFILTGISALVFATVSYPNVLDSNKYESQHITRSIDDYEQGNFLDYIFGKDTEETIEYDYQLIEDAINNNPNIGSSEKGFILNNLRFIFDEYHEYMDLKLVINRLATLRIEYIGEVADNNPNSILKTIGQYYNTDNKIIVGNASSFDDANKTVLLHEFFHVLQVGGMYDYSHLFELSDQVFTEEAMWRANMAPKGSEGSGYAHLKYIYYALAELIPKDVLIKFQFTCHLEDVADALCNTDEDYEQFYLLCDNLNMLTSPQDDYEKKYVDSIKKVGEVLDYFYLKYKGYSFYDDACFVLENTNSLHGSDMETYVLTNKIGVNPGEYRDFMYVIPNFRHRTYFSDAIKSNVLEIELQPFMEFNDDLEGATDDLSKVLSQVDDKQGVYTYSVDSDFQKGYLQYMENPHESLIEFRNHK